MASNARCGASGQVWREQAVVKNRPVRGENQLHVKPAIAKIRTAEPGDLALQAARPRFDQRFLVTVSLRESCFTVTSNG